MCKISCAGCLGISPAISAQFTVEICVAARSRKNFSKTLYFGVSWSFKVIDVDISKKRVVNDKQHV